jgi:hypothetical protein
MDAARLKRRPVGQRWSVDETYVKVAGVWRYIYRVVDEDGQVVDVFLSKRCGPRVDEPAAAITRSLPGQVCARRVDRTFTAPLRLATARRPFGNTWWVEWGCTPHRR